MEYNIKRRLKKNEKCGINSMRKRGFKYEDIINVYKCSPSTVTWWSDDVKLYKSLNKIRKKRIGKPHKKHKPHKRGLERKRRIKKKDEKYFQIARKVAELYIKHKSSTKVQEELKKQGVEMTPATILKRVKEMKELNKEQ